ncbi:MAG: sigma-54-dependent Fis family transcriptional regulator [Desulfobacteraceae bacterium]|nr:MAG: sigma-54-dependent Fis family transcriptional regulator [Desulfobacteraceae bacterium]
MQNGPPIIGVSPAIERIRDLINHVADTGLNIVISGETGVGKEVIAQNLYQKSPRRGKPFVKVNCAALPEGLLESELYGYERGAFTGAEQKRKGKFELANGGVLFLDEIGDMPILLQSKLLHVLQSGEFAPLGSEKEFKTDTWLIAATNHDLEDEIKKQKFREDLYYRLNIIKFYIPPLRERIEDIPHLINYYIEMYTSQYNNRSILQPNSRILQKLSDYHWPGNVRELQNVLKRVLVLGTWDEIIGELDYNSNRSTNTVSHEPNQAKTPQFTPQSLFFENGRAPSLESFSLKEIKKTALDKIEKEAIAYVLEKTGWNRSRASKILKISYKTLLYKISDLGIQPPLT